MICKLIAALALAIGFAASVLAQPPANIRTRLTDLKEIKIGPGLTRIANAENDGRDAQVFHAWRGNGNAWGYGVYVVTMPIRFEGGKGSEWSIVGVQTEKRLEHEITAIPHTGEDDLFSVRFVRGKLDGKVETLLVTAERAPTGPVTDPVRAAIRIYVLRNHEDEGVGTTSDAFDPVITFTTTAAYKDADDALAAELGLDPHSPG